MSKLLKRLMVSEYTKVLDGVPACLVVGYQGVDAETSHAMRGDLQQSDPPIHFQVVKNRIAGHVMSQHGLTGLDDLFEGPSALVYGGDDPVDLSKRMVDWAKKVKPLQLKGGFLQGRGVLDAKQVQELSKIPSREVLLGQLASACAGPVRNLASSLQGIIRKLAFALNAVKEAREQG